MRKSMRAVDAGATRGISQRTAACDAPPTAVAAAVTAASPRSNRLPAGSASQRRTKHQTGGHRGRPEQEAVMGHAIPKQHPAVVLRSHFNLVRALLGVAMIALVGLTIALVVVANDDNDSGSTSAVQAAPAAPALPAYPSPEAVSPGAGRSYSGPVPTRKLDGSTDIPSPAPVAPGTRYDGGPEEGSRGIARSGSAAEVYVNPSTGLPGTRYDGGPEEGSRGLHTAPIAPDTRYDGGPEEGSRGPLTSRVAPDTRYDGGPEEGTRGPGFTTD